MVEALPVGEAECSSGFHLAVGDGHDTSAVVFCFKGSVVEA